MRGTDVTRQWVKRGCDNNQFCFSSFGVLPDHGPRGKGRANPRSWDLCAWAPLLDPRGRGQPFPTLHSPTSLPRLLLRPVPLTREGDQSPCRLLPAPLCPHSSLYDGRRSSLSFVGVGGKDSILMTFLPLQHLSSRRVMAFDCSFWAALGAFL